MMRGCKWENGLKETNMTRSVNTIGGGVKTEISMLGGGVTNEYTWS